MATRRLCALILGAQHGACKCQMLLKIAGSRRNSEPFEKLAACARRRLETKCGVGMFCEKYRFRKSFSGTELTDRRTLCASRGFLGSMISAYRNSSELLMICVSKQLVNEKRKNTDVGQCLHADPCPSTPGREKKCPPQTPCAIVGNRILLNGGKTRAGRVNF